MSTPKKSDFPLPKLEAPPRLPSLSALAHWLVNVEDCDGYALGGALLYLLRVAVPHDKPLAHLCAELLLLQEQSGEADPAEAAYSAEVLRRVLAGDLDLEEAQDYGNVGIMVTIGEAWLAQSEGEGPKAEQLRTILAGFRAAEQRDERHRLANLEATLEARAAIAAKKGDGVVPRALLLAEVARDQSHRAAYEAAQQAQNMADVVALLRDEAGHLSEQDEKKRQRTGGNRHEES